MFKRAMLVLAAVLLAAVLIHAQEAKTYIGPQLGWQKASDAENGKFMPGGALRIKFTPSFSFEGSINYRQEEYANGNIKVTTWPVMLTGMLYPVNTVYGAIGVGWYNTAIDYSSQYHALGINDNRKQSFGWHFGAGTEIPLSENHISPSAVLTADFRYVFLNYNFTEVPGSKDIKSNYFVVTVGLLFGI